MLWTGIRDGAATMKGQICGVAAVIQLAEARALYVHCLAHCTNLCLQTAAKKLLCSCESLELVMGLSQLIQLTPKRSTLLEGLQQILAPGNPPLKPFRPTLWAARTGAIDSVVTNYSVLPVALDEVQQGTDEYALKAVGYLILWRSSAHTLVSN